MKNPPLSAAAIRRLFVEYFEAQGHTHVPSSSLVPKNDPSLLFVNAGMNQFKDVFTGREARPYSRAVSVQLCMRAGGKHNDLDNVGFTPRHQTLFEMLGNFSFGDYFKREAIDWGWGFLTEVLKIPAERLAVTVFNGEGEAAPADDEAFELWRRYVPEGRIYRCSAKDNFWQMGNTGPCGPCSEIHLFRGDAAPSHAGQRGRGPAYEDTAYLELWNLVFMQYEKQEGGGMVSLPKPSIDTGSGLERVAATVAGVESNYETDLLEPLVTCAKRLAGSAGTVSASEASFRVIADHARATAFLVSERVFPDKKDAAYVLRRIMRRAIRHGTNVGLDRLFFHEVCARVVEIFGDVYPMLQERAATIREVVMAEEEAFRRTLDRGLRLLDREFERLGSKPEFDPAVAADLYTTYGFPIDLTGVIVAERGKTLDETAANAAIERGSGGVGGLPGDRIGDVYFALHTDLGDSEFTGYEHGESESTITAMVVGGARVTQVEAGTEVEVILDRTPMYAEGGGQVGDHGRIVGDDFELEVTDVHKPVGKLHVHRAKVLRGRAAVGNEVRVRIDRGRRAAIRRNHSATHLLHLALRAELGDHVLQKGSEVSAERLRFDFSHNKPLSLEQRQRVERFVNERVLANLPSETDLMNTEEAKNAGAIGLFEAKYGETVRVVRIGGDSLELCGGTHVARSGDIGLFVITAEQNIAQGVRRIEAVTGEGALLHVQRLIQVSEASAGLLHVAGSHELPDRIERLQGDLKARDREIDRLRQTLASGGGDATDEVAEVGGVKLLRRRVAVGDPKALRAAADTLRDRLRTGVVVLGAETEGKATLLVAVTKDLQARVHAGKLVAALAAHVDGRGGGRPDLAQAGGPNLAGLDTAISAAPEALAELLAAGT